MINDTENDLEYFFRTTRASRQRGLETPTIDAAMKLLYDYCTNAGFYVSVTRAKTVVDMLHQADIIISGTTGEVPVSYRTRRLKWLYTYPNDISLRETEWRAYKEKPEDAPYLMLYAFVNPDLTIMAWKIVRLRDALNDESIHWGEPLPSPDDGAARYAMIPERHIVHKERYDDMDSIPGQPWKIK